MTSYNLARAYSRLRALKLNLPAGAYVAERFFREYNRVLEEELSPEVDIEEFRIDPEFELRRCPEDSEWPLLEEGSSAISCSNRQYVMHRASFLLKLDAVLGYFDWLGRLTQLHTMPLGVNRDRLTRARSRIVALKENLPPGAYVSERWVHEYHKILRRALPYGFGAAELHVRPEFEVRKLRRRLDRNDFDELDTASRVKTLVHRTLFLVKVDAVLHYCDVLARESPSEAPRSQSTGSDRARPNR